MKVVIRLNYQQYSFQYGCHDLVIPSIWCYEMYCCDLILNSHIVTNDYTPQLLWLICSCYN